jgi:hypothetical protein
VPGQHVAHAAPNRKQSGHARKLAKNALPQVFFVVVDARIVGAMLLVACSLLGSGVCWTIGLLATLVAPFPLERSMWQHQGPPWVGEGGCVLCVLFCCGCVEVWVRVGCGLCGLFVCFCLGWVRSRRHFER